MKKVHVWTAATAAGLFAAGAAHAAPVAWTGAGDGVNWSDPANWSGGALPGAADDVTINVAANPTISVAGVNPSIRSLTTAEIITFTAGTTFSVSTTAACSAPMRLAGGAIVGGAWTFSGGAAFHVTGTNESRLAAPAITGEIVHMDSNSRIRVAPGTTFSVMRLRTANATLSVEPGFVLTGQVVSEIGGAHIDMTANGAFSIAPTGSIVTSGASSSFALGQPYWYSGQMALTVQGLVSASTAGSSTVIPSSLTLPAGGVIENTGSGSLTVGVRTAPLAWTNSGTLRVTNGVLTTANTFTNAGTIEVSGTGRLALTDTWTNSGVIAVSGSGRVNLDGAFITSAIGTITRTGPSTVIAVVGQWNNTGLTYALNATTGRYLLSGGTITGGAITVAGGASLQMDNASNTLAGVNYGGEIVCEGSNSRVRLNAGTTITGLRLRGANGGASFAAGTVINYPVILDGTGSIGTIGLDTIGGGTLTLGPSGSITAPGDWTGTLQVGPAWWSGACSFVNQGQITVAGASRTLTLGGTQFTNAPSGAITTSAGVTLSVDVSGADTNSWSNAGTLSATDCTVNFRDLWSLTGATTITNGALNLDGRFPSSALAAFTRIGGQTNLTGRMDNTGATATLGPSTGSLRLAGGSIVGGTMVTTDTHRLIPTGTPSTLDSVTLTRELVFEESSSGRLVILGSFSAPAIRIRGSSSGVSFSSGFVVNFPIISESLSAATHGIDSVGTGATLTIGPSGSITTAPGSLGAVQVGEAWWGRSTETLVNQGLIESSALNRELRVVPSGTLTNSGVIRARNGVDVTTGGLAGSIGGVDIADAGSSVILNGSYTLAGTYAVNPGTTTTLRGTWSNSGTINIQDGVLQLDGSFSLGTLGAYTNSGGTVSILGTFDNAAGLTLNAATGAWAVAGGTIIGGVVNQTQGSVLRFGVNTLSTLTDVQFPSELNLGAASARLRMQGSTRAASYRVSASGASIGFPPGYVLNETLIAEGPGSKGVETVGDGTLIIAASGRIRCQGGSLILGSWQFTGAHTLSNLGTIEADGPTASINVNPTVLTNLDAEGVLTGGQWRLLNNAAITLERPVLRNSASITLTGASAGGQFIDALAENAGALTLTGGRDAVILLAAQSATTFVNRGSLTLGPGSRLTMGNSSRAVNFTQTSSGVIRFELGGPDAFTGFGNLRVNGLATLDGGVNAEYVSGYARTCGQVFEVIDANARSGQFSTLDLPPITDETVFLTFFEGPDVRFSVSARADFNQDGFLDFFDYDDFVRCFEGDCPPGLDADFNLDGFVDFFDYDDYVFRFEAGCE